MRSMTRGERMGRFLMPVRHAVCIRCQRCKSDAGLFVGDARGENGPLVYARVSRSVVSHAACVKCNFDTCMQSRSFSLTAGLASDGEKVNPKFLKNVRLHNNFDLLLVGIVVVMGLRARRTPPHQIFGITRENAVA